MDRVAKVTGRQYHLFDYVGHPEAERVVVAMGSGTEVLQSAVEHLNKLGEKVGLVKVRRGRLAGAAACPGLRAARAGPRRSPAAASAVGSRCGLQTGGKESGPAASAQLWTGGQSGRSAARPQSAPTLPGCPLEPPPPRAHFYPAAPKTCPLTKHPRFACSAPGPRSTSWRRCRPA
jgi:hypothetical protein